MARRLAVAHGTMFDAKQDSTRLKVRHAFVMMLGALLLMSLSAGCGSVPEPLREGQSHILQDGFRNTNPVFAPPSLWERLTFLPLRTWTTTFHTRTAQLPRVENDGREIGRAHV